MQSGTGDQMMQRTITVACSISLAAGLCLSLAAEADENDAQAKAESRTSEIVSVDAEAKTLTVKKLTTESTEKDPETLAVEGKAVARLADVKSGDKVVLTCKEGTGEGAASEGKDSQPEASSKTPAGTASPCVVIEMEKAP
jgi:Cu/Ag efflux protein CusF